MTRGASSSCSIMRPCSDPVGTIRPGAARITGGAYHRRRVLPLVVLRSATRRQHRRPCQTGGCCRARARLSRDILRAESQAWSQGGICKAVGLRTCSCRPTCRRGPNVGHPDGDLARVKENDHGAELTPPPLAVCARRRGGADRHLEGRVKHVGRYSNVPQHAPFVLVVSGRAAAGVARCWTRNEPC
jgi:hypothetical protein